MSNQPNLEKAVIDIASYVTTAKNAESGGQGNPATISQAMVRAAIEKALQGELGKRLDNISDTLLLVQKAIEKSSTPPNPATSTPAPSTPTPSAPAPSTPTPSESGNQNTGEQPKAQEQQPGTPVKELVRSLNFLATVQLPESESTPKNWGKQINYLLSTMPQEGVWPLMHSCP